MRERPADQRSGFDTNSLVTSFANTKNKQLLADLRTEALNDVFKFKTSTDNSFHTLLNIKNIH